MRTWLGCLAALALPAGAAHLRADMIPSQPWPELGGAFLVPHPGPDLRPGALVRAWDGSPAEDGARLAGIGWPGDEGAVSCLVFHRPAPAWEPDAAGAAALGPGIAGGQPWGWPGRAAPPVVGGWPLSGGPSAAGGAGAAHPHGSDGPLPSGHTAFSSPASSVPPHPRRAWHPGVSGGDSGLGHPRAGPSAGDISPAGEVPPAGAVAQVPEPSTAALLALGAATLAVYSHRLRRRPARGR